MKKILLSLIYLFLCGWSLPVSAVPVLQLDIGGGFYNPASNDPLYNPRYDPETIVAPGNTFTLYALMKEGHKTSVNDTYYLSVALYPGIKEASPNFGSFIFNGGPQSTQDMTYGNPGIPDHGVFDTYFKTYSFKFNPSNQVGEYNTQNNPGQFSDYYPGTGLYYAAFNFDTINLSGDVALHFDLYNSNNVFAPFSHDAQSDPPPTGVAEPTTLWLFGFGLAGLIGLRRRLKS